MKVLVRCPGCRGKGWFTCVPTINPWTTGRVVGYFLDEPEEGEEVAMECLPCDGLGYKVALTKFPEYSLTQLHFVAIQGLDSFRKKQKRGEETI
jgi:hypothetical protein